MPGHKNTAQRVKLQDRAAILFAIGKFVMLPIYLVSSDGKEHPDAGRIGKILSASNGKLAVEFFNDELIGKLTACILPTKYWLPVPEFCVEPYELRSKKNGWRLSSRGLGVFDDMKWPKNAATEGQT